MIKITVNNVRMVTEALLAFILLNDDMLPAGDEVISNISFKAPVDWSEWKVAETNPYYDMIDFDNLDQVTSDVLNFK